MKYNKCSYWLCCRKTLFPNEIINNGRQCEPFNTHTIPQNIKFHYTEQSRAFASRKFWISHQSAMNEQAVQNMFVFFFLFWRFIYSNDFCSSLFGIINKWFLCKYELLVRHRIAKLPGIFTIHTSCSYKMDGARSQDQRSESNRCVCVVYLSLWIVVVWCVT